MHMQILRSTAIISSITGQMDMDTAGPGNDAHNVLLEEEEEEDVDLAAPVVRQVKSASKSSRMSKSHRQASSHSARHRFIGNSSMEMAADQREPVESANRQEVDQMPSPGEVEPWGGSQFMEEHGHYKQVFPPGNSTPLSSQSLQETVDQRGRSKALPVLQRASYASQKAPAHASSRHGSTSLGTTPLSIFMNGKMKRRSAKYVKLRQDPPDILEWPDLPSSPSPTGSPLATSIPAQSVYSEPEDNLSPGSSPYVPLASITGLKLTGMNSGSAIDRAQHMIGDDLMGDGLIQLGSDQGNDSSELTNDQLYQSPLQASSREGPGEGTILQPQSSSFHRQGVESGSRSSTVIDKYRSKASSQEVGIDGGLPDVWSQLGDALISPQHTVNIPTGSGGGIISTSLQGPMQERGKGKQAGQLENTSKRRLHQQESSSESRDSSSYEEVSYKRPRRDLTLSFGMSVSGVGIQPKKAHKK